MSNESSKPLGQSRKKEFDYDMRDYRITRMVCRFLLKTVGFTLLAKIDKTRGLENVPASGPAILMINHIAFIDPVVVVHTLKRDVVPLAKREVYDLPFFGIFTKWWGVIPIHREGVDRNAIQKALSVLKAGELLLVAPEGTRSGQLQEAREGVAYLASRSGAPIIPTMVNGTEGFPTIPFSKRWWGEGAELVFGKPFKFREGGESPRGAYLKHMMDEAMYVLAELLPAARRGFYSDLSLATQETIEWL